MIEDLEDFVLITLSFFEAMTFSKIILDFDKDHLKLFPHFNREELKVVLKNLEKKKRIKQVVIELEAGWIRIHPQRSLWKKILFYL